MLLSPKKHWLCLPCFSSLGKGCTTFLESPLSRESDQPGKGSNSILTPDWPEPKGRAWNHTWDCLSCNHHWQPAKSVELTTNPYYTIVILPISDSHTHRTLSSKATLFLYLTFPPFHQEAHLSLVLLLIHWFHIFVDFFSLFSSICLIFFPFAPLWASRNGSVAHLFSLFRFISKSPTAYWSSSLEYPNSQNKTWYHFTKSALLPFFPHLRFHDPTTHQVFHTKWVAKPSWFHLKNAMAELTSTLFPLSIASSGSHPSLF